MKILITLILIWLTVAAISLCIEWYKRPLSRPFNHGGISTAGIIQQYIASLGWIAPILSILVWPFRKLIERKK